MRQRLAPQGQAAYPGSRRPRVLIEDANLSPTTEDVQAAHAVGLDLSACTGPSTASEACPLVVDGTCPLGTPDLVVSALRGCWQLPVAAAWKQEGVPVAFVDAGGATSCRPHIAAAFSLGLSLSAPGTEALSGE